MRAAFALVIVALAALPAQAKRKKGRVVRIERSHSGTPRTLRMCSNPQADGSAVCYGVPPEIGETGIVVDDGGVKGRVTINSVSPSLDTCGNATGWNVTSTVISGDLSQLTSSGAIMLDYDVGQGAHVISNNTPPLPNPRSTEIEMIAYSNDGDDVPEIFESWYMCDLGGVERSWATGQAGYYCLVYYGRADNAYREERVDVVKNCY
jgi:hypothetical protein